MDDTLIKFAIGEDDKGDVTVRLRDASETLLVPKTDLLKSADDSLRSLEVEFTANIRPKEWEEMKTFLTEAQKRIFGPFSDLEQNQLRLLRIFYDVTPEKMRRAGFTSDEVEALKVWTKDSLEPYLQKILRNPAKNQALLESLDLVFNRIMTKVMYQLIKKHPAEKTQEIAKALVSNDAGLMRRLLPLLKDEGFTAEKEMMELALAAQSKLVSFMKIMSEASKQVSDFRRRFIQISSRVSNDAEITLAVQKWFDDSLFGSWRAHFETVAMKTEQKLWMGSIMESAFKKQLSA